MTTKEKRVTWRERGAPGCSKCRFRGCRTCLERLKVKPEVLAAVVSASSSAASSAIVTPEQDDELQQHRSAAKSKNYVDNSRGRSEALGSHAGSVASMPSVVGAFEKACSTDEEANELHPKKRRKKQHVEDEPILAEIEASNEIDRLLEELNASYHRHAQKTPALDPYETIFDAKKKWGSETLLTLMKTKMCCKCKTKLGIYFYHEHLGKVTDRVSESKCQDCFTPGNWTPSQAEEALRLKGLGRVISSKYQHSEVVSSGWCKGSKLYSSHTVTMAAVAAHGSVWELHWALAKYEKRRRA